MKEQDTSQTTYSLRKLALLNDIEKTREKDHFIALYTAFAVIFGKPEVSVDQGLRQLLAQAIAQHQAPSGDLVEAELIITLTEAVIRPYNGKDIHAGVMNVFSSQIVGFTPGIEAF